MSSQRYWCLTDFDWSREASKLSTKQLVRCKHLAWNINWRTWRINPSIYSFKSTNRVFVNAWIKQFELSNQPVGRPSTKKAPQAHTFDHQNSTWKKQQNCLNQARRFETISLYFGTGIASWVYCSPNRSSCFTSRTFQTPVSQDEDRLDTPPFLKIVNQ